MEAFVAACGGAMRTAGRETVFRCPCHAAHTNGDATPSGNVRIGDDSRLLVKCRANCHTKDIVAAIGWTMADLMPRAGAKNSAAAKGTRPPKKKYASLQDVAAAAARAKKGKHESTHVYLNAEGDPVLGVVRVRHADGSKEVPQIRPEGGGWVFGGIGKDRPLYNLPELLSSTTDTPVLVFEGEQKADRAKSLGFVATTTSQGAGNAHLTDLAPLARRIVHLFPDNDEVGRDHMHDVAWRAYSAGAASVTLVTLTDLPPKGDIIDYYTARKNADATDDQIADEIRDAITVANEVPRPDQQPQQQQDGHGDDEAREAPGKPNQADLLVALASDATLFHDEHDEAYASITVNGHGETWRIGSQQFVRWLCSEFYRTYRTAVPPQALATAASQLGAIALFDGEVVSVHVRVATTPGALWIDLCNEKWQAVEISAAGWRVVDEPPVRFIRRHGMKALPVPVAGFRSLDPLFDLLHVEGQEVRLLVTAWLVNAAMHATSYPMVALTGEQGSGKTTFCRALQRLVDPHEIEGRSPPRNEEDIAVAAQHAHLLVYENLSAISQPLSDALCRVATGAGFAARKLYTDADERQLTFCRPVVINGIDDLVTKSDLADRVVSVHLEPIPPARRRTEAALWAAYNEMHPRLLGALLNLVVKVLSTPDQDVQLERMAEYSQLGAKVAVALGLAPAAFLDAYRGNRDHSSLAAIESSSIGPVLLRLVRKGPLSSPMRSLLFELQGAADKYELRHPSWPGHPRALGNELRRLSPNLARTGVSVRFPPRRKDGYWVEIEETPAADVHHVHHVHQQPQKGAE